MNRLLRCLRSNPLRRFAAPLLKTPETHLTRPNMFRKFPKGFRPESFNYHWNGYYFFFLSLSLGALYIYAEFWKERAGVYFVNEEDLE